MVCPNPTEILNVLEVDPARLRVLWQFVSHGQWWTLPCHLPMLADLQLCNPLVL